MHYCNECLYSKVVFHQYQWVMCTARKSGLTPWWYIEGKSAPEQTPIFPWLKRVDCPVWKPKKEGADELDQASDHVAEST